MYCPVCKSIELRKAERQGVEIDFCPQCRGVWLDRGELDKIIQRVSGEENRNVSSLPPQAAPQLRSERREEYHRHTDEEHNKPKKQKSLLDDLFDLF